MLRYRAHIQADAVLVIDANSLEDAIATAIQGALTNGCVQVIEIEAIDQNGSTVVSSHGHAIGLHGFGTTDDPDNQ